MSYSVIAFNRADPGHIAHLVALWNAACGPDLAFTERLAEHNTRPGTGLKQAGRLAFAGEEPAGVVLASAASDGSQAHGWIDVAAVAPRFQRRGLGSDLLRWAEAWLREQDVAAVHLGGGLRHFTAGLPVELGAQPFFEKRGFRSVGHAWDVARTLTDDDLAAPAPPAIRPAQPGDFPAFDEFLQREFPGRWRYEVQEARRDGARLSDYLLLWEAGRVEGFCRLVFEDSYWPLERVYMRRLPRPWGQLGPIGVGRAVRGQGQGGALLRAGLRALRARGVAGCVIDWTSLLAFYRKFGFEPYRQYGMMVKEAG